MAVVIFISPLAHSERLLQHSARAGNRRFWSLSDLRVHTKAPYKMDFRRKTLRALNRPWAARTVQARVSAPLRLLEC